MMLWLAIVLGVLGASIVGWVVSTRHRLARAERRWLLAILATRGPMTGLDLWRCARLSELVATERMEELVAAGHVECRQRVYGITARGWNVLWMNRSWTP